MLIRRAELDFGARIGDVRVRDGRVAAIAPRLDRVPGEQEVDAQGGALLPALHDRHLHLYALAAAQASVQAGPPQCRDAAQLEAALRAADGRLPPGTWLRAVGFHDSVMAGSDAELDRVWLDRVLPQRPARVQHRSGRRWTFNSAALRALGVGPDSGDPVQVATGHLLDGDDWLRQRLPAARPDLRAVGAQLWSWGVVACTDTGYTNSAADFAALADAQARGELPQDLTVMGDASLDAVRDRDTGHGCVRRGAHKFHLHEHDLPDFDALCADLRRAHDAGRGVAFHCVTRVELIFALAALRTAGARAGDRIEHASVAPPETLREIRALGLHVVTQPGFVAERGDRYLREVAEEDRPWLYRAQSWLAAGVPLSFSSDAPYSSPNPWHGMAAAVERATAGGVVLGETERVSAQAAFEAWSALPRVAVEAPASLCLLPAPWSAVERDLRQTAPRGVWKGGVGTFTCSE